MVFCDSARSAIWSAMPAARRCASVNAVDCGAAFGSSGSPTSMPASSGLSAIRRSLVWPCMNPLFYARKPLAVIVIDLGGRQAPCRSIVVGDGFEHGDLVYTQRAAVGVVPISLAQHLRRHPDGEAVELLAQHIVRRNGAVVGEAPGLDIPASHNQYPFMTSTVVGRVW